MTERSNTPWRPRPELVVLLLLAVLTRFWGLFHPGVVVFDEKLFEQYAGAYFSGSFYFDVHPPLGKLLVAGMARLAGVPGTVLEAAQPALIVRLLPATAGALIVPFVWLMLRQLGAGRTVAAFGATMVLFDNALLVQSRFILLDTTLIAFELAATTLFLAARSRGGAGRWWFLAASGVGAGLAASVKWTGLAALGLIVLTLLSDAVRSGGRWSRRTAEALVVVALASGAYAGTFAVHFALLDRSGPGDAWMSPAFQATLRGPRYNPSAHVSFGAELLDAHRAMVRSEGMLRTATHEYASRWYAWPFLIRPIHFWRSEPLPGGRIENIHLLGNPVVWLGVLVGVVITAVGALRKREAFAPWRPPLAFLAAGLAINYLPLTVIPRVLFIYSYLPTLLFEIALASFGLGILAGWTREPERLFAFPTRRSRALYWTLSGAAALAFAVVAPISYGWPVKVGGIYTYTPYHVPASSSTSPATR